MNRIGLTDNGAPLEPDLKARLRAYKARKHARDLLAAQIKLVAQKLDDVQKRCTQRLLDVEDVLGVLRGAWVHGIAGTASPHVANSYGYPYTWTHAKAYRDCDVVYWGVARVGRTGDAQTNGGAIHIEALERLAPPGPALPGEWALVPARGSTYRRFAFDGKPTGAAVKAPKVLWGRWEHGSTVAVCRAEIRSKRAILASETALAAATARDQRATRLLARLSTRITVTRADARDAGYCLAGIEAWCRSHGVDVDVAIPLANLAKDPEPRARALAIRVANKVWAAHRYGV